MTRALAAAPLGLVVFIGVLVLAASAVRSGLMADDAVTLWAGAITAGDGRMPIGLISAAYPTIPFLMSTLIESVAPAGTPAPALLAAAIAAILACVWFVALRNTGRSAIVAGAIALLLVLHPGILRAALAGPSEILLVAFLAMLASALFDLRARSGVSEVMAVGLALVGLAFSHPMGAAMVCAAVPFLIFAVRPALAANSAVNVLVALIFPCLFAAASFAYVSWVFPGAGWTFLTSAAEGVSTWEAAFAHGLGELTGLRAFDAAIAAALAFVLGAPVAILVLIKVFHRQPLVMPAVVFAAAAVTAAALAAGTGLFGDPVAITAAAPVLAAILVIRIADIRDRTASVLALLVAGWFGGALALASIDPRLGSEASAAVMAFRAGAGINANLERSDALDLGGATAAREGVLVDSLNAPAIVVGRGSAAGLFSPTTDDFSLALLTSSITAPFVAVPDPQSRVGTLDRLNKAFPRLYRRGQPGYRLIYGNNTWRLFARE
jgi:hypothetical protein